MPINGQLPFAGLVHKGVPPNICKSKNIPQLNLSFFLLAPFQKIVSILFGRQFPFPSQVKCRDGLGRISCDGLHLDRKMAPMAWHVTAAMVTMAMVAAATGAEN